MDRGREGGREGVRLTYISYYNRRGDHSFNEIIEVFQHVKMASFSSIVAGSFTKLWQTEEDGERERGRGGERERGREDGGEGGEGREVEWERGWREGGGKGER